MQIKKAIVTGALALTTIVAGAGAASAASTYTVTGQDTMWTISVKQGIPLNNLIRLNPQVANPNIIWPGMVLNVPTQSSKPSTPSAPAASAAAKSTFASQVVTLVNQERAKAGLKPLAVDSELSVMALDKAKDMYNNGFFDHTSPTYGSPFEMMNSYGIRYTYAGENIALGQRTPQDVMKAWMNSPGHKANILNAHYTKLGVAYYNSEWVQEFIAN